MCEIFTDTRMKKKKGGGQDKEGSAQHRVASKLITRLANLYSRFLVSPVGMLWPLNHAHDSAGHVLCGRVIALWKGQQESQDPDDKDDHFGSSGRQPGLERVNDGHVSAVQKKGQHSVIMCFSCP